MLTAVIRSLSRNDGSQSELDVRVERDGPSELSAGSWLEPAKFVASPPDGSGRRRLSHRDDRTGLVAVERFEALNVTRQHDASNR
jgi:hypothetical protein